MDLSNLNDWQKQLEEKQNELSKEKAYFWLASQSFYLNHFFDKGCELKLSFCVDDNHVVISSYRGKKNRKDQYFHVQANPLLSSDIPQYLNIDKHPQFSNLSYGQMTMKEFINDDDSSQSFVKFMLGTPERIADYQNFIMDKVLDKKVQTTSKMKI